ncbi:sensor histidine kinase [Paenibacillus aurantiacus]|uniref:histidine kinase n=1 Tax=Paenibacillus aurantiacus TaxID=1936118 RepID=A0ABV5KU13_9BACL
MTRERVKQGDLFVKTRRKLTVTYTWLIILFLVIFSLIVSVFFVGMAYREQRQTLHSTIYASDNGSVEIPDLTGTSVEDLYFYYIVDHQGNVLSRSEAIPQNADLNLEKIEAWHPNRESYRLVWLDVPHSHHEWKRTMERDRLLYIGARPYVTQDGKEATIYAAKDVTFYLDVYQDLLVILLCILALFLIASIWLSYSMSKKAMIPIQQSYRQQQQFLADASHELRTPLSIMNTSLDVIEIENGEDFTSYTKEVMSDMREEVGRMSRMVQHLLLLARSDSGTVQFDMLPFDLVSKIGQWLIAIEAVAQNRKINISVQMPEELEVVGDMERIKQLVYILLDNAIKFTPDNGTVEITIVPHVKQWCLMVKDTGIGIPEEDQGRIFDRFYRVEKHRSRDEGSAGLGLSIAKWIVEAHQGSIEVESVLNEGSTFIVKIPYDLL